jgi:hypothetical protein
VGHIAKAHVSGAALARAALGRTSFGRAALACAVFGYCAMLAGCAGASPSVTPAPLVTPEPVALAILPSPDASAPPDPVPSASPNVAPDRALSRPDWIGTRVLKPRPDGFGYAQPTPAELVNRKMPPRLWFADPLTTEWRATISPVPAYVIARSTWHAGCPVEVNELAYVVMTYWGFDDKAHMGEMLINASVAADIVNVFHTLYDARYPIEEMRVWSVEEMNAPPTGDINMTDSYTCRPVVTTTSGWSMHSYGLAIDLNPFQNPYKKGSLVIPELSTSYLDRGNDRPGMVHHGDLAWQAFRDIGWGWGGDWSSLKDYTHFSSNSR